MSEFPRYLPWIPQLVCLLLNLEGVHNAKKSDIIKKWNLIKKQIMMEIDDDEYHHPHQ